MRIGETEAGEGYAGFLPSGEEFHFLETGCTCDTEAKREAYDQHDVN